MRALTLAVLKVLGLDEVDTGASPLLGERVCVIDVHVDGSAAHPLRIDAGSREMDRQPFAMGERITLVMMRGTEAQLLVMGNRPRHIRDHENRLDTDDATHTEILRVVAYLRLPRGSGFRGHSRTLAQPTVSPPAVPRTTICGPMPDFPLALHDPDETLSITLSKRPTTGVWFDLEGLTVMVKDVRWIGSEVVIFGARVSQEERARLNPKKQRRAARSH
jgi:hypothetical protein